MAKLFHIQSSPRGNHAASIMVAKRFIEAYSAAHPDDTVETLDLWQTRLPEFDGPTLDAKYAVLNGQPHAAEQLNAWQAVTSIAMVKRPGWPFVSESPNTTTIRAVGPRFNHLDKS